jgi:hypothetical protein
MKYLWIIMLIALEIFWFITSLIDFIKTSRRYKIKYILTSLDDSTCFYILIHVMALFAYSVYLFFKK